MKVFGIFWSMPSHLKTKHTLNNFQSVDSVVVETRDKSQPPKILGCTKMLRNEPQIFGEGPSNDDSAECDFQAVGM